MQLRKKAWKKFKTSTGFEPVTSGNAGAPDAATDVES